MKAPPADVGAFQQVQALTVWDRFSIVSNTAGQYQGRADVQANRLWLSARGGLLDSIGKWEVSEPYRPGKPTWLQWRHLATFGRDQYVKVVIKGFLFPFGHRVTLTTITERQFQRRSLTDQRTLAAFRKFFFLSVREPVVTYDKASNPQIANDSRDFPFRSLHADDAAHAPDIDSGRLRCRSSGTTASTRASASSRP